MIMVYSACDLVDGNISTWGDCILEGWFLNSPELMAVALYFVFAVIAYRTRMPVQTVLGVNMILSFILATSTSSVILDLLFLFSLVPIAGVIIFAIIERFVK